MRRLPPRSQNSADQAVFAAIDTETTGFRPGTDQIVEIGVSVLNADFVELYRWETLINPGKHIENTAIHGITDTMVSAAPTFAEIYTELAIVLDGKILIAHNAAFDASFLDTAAHNVYTTADSTPRTFAPAWIDSIDLAKTALGHGPYGLDALLERNGIANERPHSAGADAAALGALLEHLHGAGRSQASSLIATTAAFREIRAVHPLDLHSSPPLPRISAPQYI